MTETDSGNILWGKNLYNIIRLIKVSLAGHPFFFLIKKFVSIPDQTNRRRLNYI